MSVGDDRGSAFGELLRGHRLSAGLTQEELAGRSELSARAVADMERGRTARPYRRSVALLADALGLSGEEGVLFARAARAGVAAARRADLPGPAGEPAGGPAVAPASPPVVPRQLPAAVPYFAGRSAELKELTGLLDQASGRPDTVVISAIAGTAGVGKTALAVHWGHQVAHLFPDGQLYVNLRGFDPSGMPVTPAAAVRGFLDALHVPPSQIPLGLDAQTGLYRSLLAGRAMLVVLDNARDAEHVRPLLPGSPGCLAVVTSRNQLTGLVASVGACPLYLDVLAGQDAVDLLAGRLGAQRTLAEQDATGELVALCARLPLAVSVAAARAASRPQVTLAALAAELRHSRNLLDALNTGDAATDPRAVFSWSYQLLHPPAARLFRLLGLHPGPDFCAAAAGSLAGIPASHARRLLGELSGACLVAEPEPGRFSFHDLLRGYATDRAEAQELPADRASAISRVLSWYLHTAAAAAALISPGRRHVVLDEPAPQCEPLSFDDYDHALHWLETERVNLVAAIACAVRYDAHEIAWKLPITLWDLFSLRGHWAEWIEAIETGLASARHLRDRAAQGWLLNHLAIACQQSGRSEQAIGCFLEALSIRREIGDRHGEAAALANLGRSYSEAGRLPESMECLRAALSVFRDTGQKAEQARCLFSLSGTYRRQGRFEDAASSARQAVRMNTELGDGNEESGALTQLALASLCLARPAEAVAHSTRAAELGRYHGDRIAEAEALTVLGQALQDSSRPARARQSRRDAYLIFSELGDPRSAELLGLLGPDQGTGAGAGRIRS